MTDTRVTAIVISHATAHTLYLGTETGAYKCTDGAGTWHPANAGLTEQAALPSELPWPRTHVAAIAASCAAPQTLYAVTERAVFKSTDGPDVWSPVNGGLTGKTVTAVAISPTAPETLYAGAQDGVFKSTNGAKTWNWARGLPTQ